MAPVVEALREAPWAETRVVATAQHRELLDQAMRPLAFAPDIDLDILRDSPSLSQLTATLLTALDAVLESEAPDVVLAQGDTTTAMVTALACFYRNIPFGHVEAGLRTGDLHHPFPEEMNRVMAGRLARWHFAPMASARDNLLREGTPADRIWVTGNTGIDALLRAARFDAPIGVDVERGRRLVLVTAHRRENLGEPLASIGRAVRTIADRYADVQVLLPLHPNPSVRDVLVPLLDGHPRIALREPLDYGCFVSAMKRAYLILTDSGGVQEEAPALGTPVLVMRAETERPEAVAAGVARLVGTNWRSIVSAAERLLDDPAAHREMSRGASPYGDGCAAGRIVEILARAVGR